MFFIAYAFKGQVHVFAGGVKIVSHLSCRMFEMSAIFKYFCPLSGVMDFTYPSVETYVLCSQKNRLNEKVLLSTHNICFG